MLIGSLAIGAIAYCWPGGPNIIMLAGAVLLFITGLIELEDKEGSHNGNGS